MSVPVAGRAEVRRETHGLNEVVPRTILINETHRSTYSTSSYL